MRKAKIVGVVLLTVLAGVTATAVTQMASMVPAADDGVGRIEDVGGEIVITTTPVDLPLMEHGDDHEHAGVFPPVETVEIPVHGYLRGFDYDLVDGDGNVVPSEVVHHFNVIDPDHRELFLPISQRLLAAGQETGRQMMPRMLFGVPVYVGQRLVISTMLHNPTGQAYRDVALRIRLPYVKVGRPWPLFEVFPFQMDVLFPAGDKSFDLPPGKSSASWQGNPSMEGRIMALGSHLHDLATHITFEDATEDEVLWTGYPETSDEGRVTGVTVGRVYWKGGIKIVPDHEYRVTVHYDNTSADTIAAGGMGVVAGVFMPAFGGAWPRPDVADPLYALDRSHYMREVRGAYDVIVEGGGMVTDEAAEHVHDEGAAPAADGHTGH